MCSSDLKRAELQWKPEDDLVRFAGDEMVRVLVCGGDGTMEIGRASCRERV